MEAKVKDAADEKDGAKKVDDDVVPHAEGNLGDVSGAAVTRIWSGRPPSPGGRSPGTLDFAHQFLAIDGADARLVRDGKNNRIVRSGEARGWSSSMAALLAKG